MENLPRCDSVLQDQHWRGPETIERFMMPKHCKKNMRNPWRNKVVGCQYVCWDRKGVEKHLEWKKNREMGEIFLVLQCPPSYVILSKAKTQQLQLN